MMSLPKRAPSGQPAEGRPNDSGRQSVARLAPDFDRTNKAEHDFPKPLVINRGPHGFDHKRSALRTS